ncbi:MAG: hypothetical protein LC775_03435, partial [Acidobacteria bacterium]|nr:hypothetical protein [Acidobacteriota bacterium]
MGTEWYLVKYISDIFRDEPRNVGVILYGDHGGSAQFIGETDVGTFDGRRAKGVVSSADTLKEWISYLRHHMEVGSFHEAIDALRRRSLDNYRIERRGSLLVEPSSDDDLDRVTRELFNELVTNELVTTAGSSSPDLTEVVNDILFNRITVPPGRSIEKDVEYEVDLRGALVKMHFDYRYVNGFTTLMERVSLAGADLANARRVNDLLFRIDNVREQDIRSFLTLYDFGKLGCTSSAEKHLNLLEKYTFVVYARADDAATQVSE